MPDSIRQEYTSDQLYEDLAYLVDELTALKPLTEVVPVLEKPGDELSIAEIFAALSLAQQKALSGDKINSFDFIIVEMKAKSSDDEATLVVSEILDEIIKNRSQLLKRAENKEIPGDTLVNLVLFERNQLRIIAERILTITTKE